METKMSMIAIDLTDFYLDYVNNYITVKGIADHFLLTEKQASIMIDAGKQLLLLTEV